MSGRPTSVGQLHLSTRTLGDLAVVGVGGELDLATLDRLHEHLHAQRRLHGDRLVLDLRNMSFLDSSGVALLVDHYKQIRDQGGYFALAALQPQVAKVLYVTGLLEWFPVHDTVEAAVGHASGSI